MVLIDWIRLVVLSVIWGSSFLFVELAVDHLPPFTIVFLRVGLAAIALLLYCALRGIRVPLGKKHIVQYAIMGFFAHALPFTLYVWGQIYITAGLASIYNATTPLFTVLVAHFYLTDERANASKLLGVLTGFLGVAFLIGGNFGAASLNSYLGQLAALGAAICYAYSAVYGRRFSKFPPAGIAAATLTSATIFTIPLVLIYDAATLTIPPAKTIAAIGGLALLCTAVVYIISYRILARAGATKLMLVTFLIPASAIILGITFLGETLALNQLAGLALIFCGLLLVDGKVLRFFTRGPRARGT